MLFIGICGASGSGKTTLSRELVKALNNANCLEINQDAYYLDHPNLTLEERGKLNYDEPSIFDHDLLLQDFLQLESGQPIQKRSYDFTKHERNDQQALLYPPDVLIVEGIHAFYDERLLDHMYLKLYMNVEADICLLRRFNRDFKERGRTIDSITQQYLATVKPMYDKYIRNYFNQADVIVMRGGKNTRIVEILAGYLRDALYEK
ncbi:MAG: uridine kinase [Clostridiales bacterium]|nr:uridine kinase [Clostridiales bacterium]